MKTCVKNIREKNILGISQAGAGAGMHADNMGMESDEHVMQTEGACAGALDALDAFWAEHRLLHHKTELRKFLGTETFSDLDDVRPSDLETLHADRFAHAYLAIAEMARLRRAIAAHHASKHPQPLPGVEHLPRCRECACQGGRGAADSAGV